MKYVSLGRTGLKVSRICLGTMQFGWTIAESAAHEVLDLAIEMGCNFIDTADIYSFWHEGNSGGESEKVIGTWLARRNLRRSDIIIATKVRGKMGGGPNAEGLSRKHILEAVYRSLERLQTDHIDLYQVHWPDEDTPLDETLMALDSLVRAGVVRYVGSSNHPSWLLARSLAVSELRGICRYESLQPHYNLVHRAEFERELQSLCLDEQLGVLPYSPLAGGFLTGKYRPDAALPSSARATGIQDRYMNDWGFSIVAELLQIGLDHSATSAQVAIAWTLANPAVSSVIVGANSTAQLSDTFKGADLDLGTDAKAALDELSAWQ